MKKIKSLIQIITLFSSLSFLACNAEKGEDFNDFHLSVQGTHLVNHKGEIVVLRGVSLGWHNWWGRFYNASVVKTLKEQWNVNVIRVAMGVEPEEAYLDNPMDAMDKIITVIDAAIDHQLYVIIDWHSHGIYTNEAKQFFTEMATRYKDSPFVIYEIFNEPEEDSWEDVKAYSQEVIAAIRAIDTKNLILVGTPHWDQDVHLAADNPIVGYENIAYTLHFYAATHKEELRQRADYALSKGLPLFVSECASMEATGDGAIDLQEWDRWLTWMKERQISWIAWSIADKDETCSMLLPHASSQGNWQESDLKKWGKIVKKELNL